jgi:lipoic acid synthetase
MRPSLPIISEESQPPHRARSRTPTPKPAWLKVKAPSGEAYTAMKARARRLTLATVCEEAQCPNLAECWGGGTATFMLMGDTCTRACRFCAVATAKHPAALDPAEPANIAEAIDEMGLSYVVLTSVNRDDVADGGADHLLECIRAIKARVPAVYLELLMPDFLGDHRALHTIARAELAVAAHNLETVERLTPTVRDPRARYAQSLEVLEVLKGLRPDRLTKSSLMLGLGETEAEVVRAMADLRSVGVDILTLGQYLRPSHRHLPVVEYVPPERFERLGERARAMGFGYVASGPLVRSSYRAGELYVERRLAAHPVEPEVIGGSS